MGGQSGKLVISAVGQNKEDKQVEDRTNAVDLPTKQHLKEVDADLAESCSVNNTETDGVAEESKTQPDAIEVLISDTDMNNGEVENGVDADDNSKKDKKQKLPVKKRSLIHWIQKKVSRRPSQPFDAGQANENTEVDPDDGVAEVVVDEITEVLEAVKVNGDSCEPQEEQEEQQEQEQQLDLQLTDSNGVDEVTDVPEAVKVNGHSSEPQHQLTDSNEVESATDEILSN